MRLRRETGDFQITINSESEVNTIRPNLSAEDFVGEMVDVDGTFEVVNTATNTETGSVFKTNSFTLTYTKATGAITAEENESGGSGGGSGSDNISIIIHCTDIDDYSTYTVDPISENLSADDLLNASVYTYVDYARFGTVLLQRIDKVQTVAASDFVPDVPTIYTITPATRPSELIVDEGDPHYIELVYYTASGEIEILSNEEG